MYYYWPELDEAYDMKEQFMFGDDILATAVCKPVDTVTGLAEREMWFPEGQWFDCSTGAMYDGNQKVTLHYTLAENPYFAKAGAIIPMNPSTVKNLQEVCDELVLTVIPGGDGEASLYEDNGMSANYAEEYAMTTITKKVNGNVVRVVIEAREGNYEGALAERSYEVRFPAHFPPKSVKVNGKEYAYNRFAGDGEWTYDGYTLAPIVNVPKVSCGKKVVVELTFDEEAMAQQPRLYGKQGIFRRFVALTPMCKLDYGTNFDRYAMLPDAYLNVSQCPNYIMEHPFRITEWLDKYDGAKDQIVPTFEEIGTFEPELVARIAAQLQY
jgi:alpha-glucosidase